MNNPAVSTTPRSLAENTSCYFFNFGLIVTGKSERAHLPKLFKSLMAETKICNFEVIQFSGQLSPITSAKRKLQMVGAGKTIPDKDAAKIGFPARTYLSRAECNFVILIDDLEYDRRAQAQQIFDRYRHALDTVLSDKQQRRAAVHFLVYMLEAYYFANAQAVNAVLKLNPPLEDYDGDVETIRHPKNELKRLYPAFREVDDGGAILERINTEHVLSRADTCAGLRTLFAWCVKVLTRYSDYELLGLFEKYRLQDGRLNDITKLQLDALELID